MVQDSVVQTEDVVVDVASVYYGAVMVDIAREFIFNADYHKDPILHDPTYSIYNRTPLDIQLTYETKGLCFGVKTRKILMYERDASSY